MPENDAPQGGGGQAYYPNPSDTPSEFWQNKEWPNATYKTDPKSPTAWGDRTHQIPYRGAEQHGVPNLVDPNAFAPTPKQDKATVDIVEEYGEGAMVPIDVRIVDTSAPVQERRKIALSTVPVLPGQTVRIVGERRNRTALQLWTVAVTGQLTADRIWVSEQDNPQTGYVGVPLDPTSADAPWKTNTNTDLWAVCDSAGTKGTLVCVAEEYVLHIVGTNSVAPPAQKHGKVLG